MGHLDNTTGVISDRTVGIGGKSDGENGEETSGGEGNTEGTAGERAHSDDGGGDDEHRADGGVRINRQTLDADVGRAEHNTVGDALGRSVGTGGEVLRPEGEHHTSGEADHHAEVQLPVHVQHVDHHGSAA